MRLDVKPPRPAARATGTGWRWAMMFPIPFVSDVPIGFYTTTMLAMWSLYELITSVIAGLLAGALYKDAAGA